MKTLILAVNSKYVHSSLSVWILAAAAKKNCRDTQDIEVIEATINQDNKDILARILERSPDVIAVSTYIWNAAKLTRLLLLLQEKMPNAIIILGGPEASNNSEFWIGKHADYVLTGEGEESFPAFLDMLNGSVSADDIPGLIWKNDWEICRNPIVKAGCKVIDPYSDEYFQALGGRIAYIETSRGCPFSCAFCLSGGTGVRFFPLDMAKEQIFKLSKTDTQTIKFVDRTFNCDKNRAFELFEYIIGLDTDCCFHFEVAADLFDYRTISLLKTAPPGRIQLEAGLQSFYPSALEASFRQTDLEKVERNIRSILEGGNIHLHIDLIAGLPYETLEEFKKSFDRAYKLCAHTLQLGFLKLLPGSALRRQITSIECDDEPPYEITKSPWLSPQDLLILKSTENALQHTYNKGRFLTAIEYVLAASGLSSFDFYRGLGEYAPNHGMSLGEYAEEIFNYSITLPSIGQHELKERMICDWLSMVKGVNLPGFLRIHDDSKKHLTAIAEERLKRKMRRGEVAVLPSRRGVFVDGEKRNPVTGLYDTHIILPKN